MTEKPIPKPIPVRTKTPLEKDIEEKVCRYARVHNFYVRKFSSPNYRSVPDRMLISPKGHVVFIEFKAPKKQPTQAQAREIERLRDYGQRVYVVDDWERGKFLIDRFASAL